MLALQVTTQGRVRTEVVWFNFAPEKGALGELRRPELHRPRASSARRPTGTGLPAGERPAVLAAEDLAGHDEAFLECRSCCA